LLVAVAKADVLLTSGNAQLNLLESGGAVFAASNGDAGFAPDGGLPANDQLFKYTWYYRTQNNNTNRLFSSLDTPTKTVSGDTATFTWTNAGPGAVGNERFDATLTVKLTDGGTANAAKVESTMTFKASAGNAAARTYQIFNIVDLDLSGTATDDLGSRPNAGDDLLRFTESSSASYGEFRGTLSPPNWEINTGSALRNKLNSGSANLANSTVVGSGDLAGAFQWSFNLNPGESRTFSTIFTINTPAEITSTVPEPGSLGLALLVAGLLPFARRTPPVV
jgi:hypothetical protein